MRDSQQSVSLVLLYDGLCGFCDRIVQFVLRNDRTGTLRFAPLHGAFARSLLARHAELQGVDSLILVENAGTRDERVLVRSRGALRVAEYLGGWWRVLRVLRVVPRFMLDFGYDAVARLRYRLFGRYDSCPLPSEKERSRFLLD